MNPTGFVNFQQYLDANKDGAQDMADRMGAQVAQAKAGGMAGAQDQQRNAGLLKSNDGQQALLGQAYGQGQATGLDAALAGAQGGNYFQQLVQKYGNAPQNLREQQTRNADHARIRSESNKKVALETQQRQAQADPQAQVKTQADKIRQEDAMRPPGQMSKERWANLHGMSLEQWLANGQNPPL